jgi:DNA-binding NarL/FixJ family response regulator
VIVADDDADLRALMIQYLSREPFEVIGSARDAEEAIRVASQRRPDAAVVDVNMPGGGARRVVEMLSEHCPEVAVVILSGLDEDNLVRSLLGAGALAYLVKGASRDEILDTVQRAVRANRGMAR